MKKTTKILLISEIGFVLLSVILISLLSYFINDEWTDFFNRFLIFGFAYIPIFIVGLCIIHVIVTLFNKKERGNNILDLIIIALSAVYCIYVLIALLVIKQINATWFLIPILILLFWIVDLFNVISDKRL